MDLLQVLNLVPLINFIQTTSTNPYSSRSRRPYTADMLNKEMNRRSKARHDMDTDLVCNLVESHVFDPRAEVVLVFHSKNAIVSDPHNLDLISAENWSRTSNVQTDDGESGIGAATPETNSQCEMPKYRLGDADIEVRVSERHLSLVSPYFRALLSGNLVEAETLRRQGFVKITLEDDAIHGAMILLRLLHSDFSIPALTPSDHDAGCDLGGQMGLV